MKNLGESRQKFEWEELVNSAMQDPSLSKMRPVVEKELLHYEIFSALDKEGLLKGLVFQGGTCLRLCYGSYRYSEDLDFAGGPGFDANQFLKIKECLEDHMVSRFGLETSVKPPAHLGAVPDNVPVSKWTMAVVTSPANRSVPKQKIKIEVAAVAAHTAVSTPINSMLQVSFGQRPILVNAESREEIMSDKLIAFPTSLFDNKGNPQDGKGARIRFRDLWDLSWLSQKGASPDYGLVIRKISDYGIPHYDRLVKNALERIPQIINEPHFLDEMSRFIDAKTFEATLAQANYRQYMEKTVSQFYVDTLAVLSAQKNSAEPTPKVGPSPL